MKEKNIVVSSLLWRFLERVGAQGVSFIVSIILARLLEPSVYGTVALVTVFTSLMQVFIDSGMGNALIQKKNADDLDFSSVFYFNLVICFLLYVVMFIISPFISAFYGKPELTSIIRVLSIMLIISGVKNIQQAYVSKHLLFKKFFYSTLGGTIGAAFIGIYMAYKGFGIWALVTQQLFNLTVDTIILWISVKWRPQKMFSFSRLKSLFSYGSKFLISSLLDVGYRELRALIIGKLYTSDNLAFYNKGEHFPKLIVSNINTSIDSVLLPTLSSKQDDCERVKAMTRRAIKTSTFIMSPLMVGLAVCAEPLIRLILTDKWLPCVFFLRIFCVTYAFYPIHTANLNAIKAMGRSDLFLILEIIKKVIGLIALIVTMFISVKAMAISLLFTSIVNQIVNSWPNRKLLKYSYLEQLKDIFPQLLISCVMGFSVYAITFVGFNDLLTLILQVITGALVYYIISKLFKIDSLVYIQSILNSYLRKSEKEHRGSN